MRLRISFCTTGNAVKVGRSGTALACKATGGPGAIQSYNSGQERASVIRKVKAAKAS